MEWSESRSVMTDSLRPRGLYGPWNSPGQKTREGSLSLLQGIFPIQGSNPGLLHCRRILRQLSDQGCPRTLDSVAFSSRSSWPRNRTRVSCIAGGFFTNGTIREALWKGEKIVRGSHGAPPPGHLWGWTAPEAPAQSACGSSCLVSRAEATKTSGTLVAGHSKKWQDSDPLIQLRGEGLHLARASSFLLASSWALSPQEHAGGR